MKDKEISTSVQEVGTSYNDSQELDNSNNNRSRIPMFQDDQNDYDDNISYEIKNTNTVDSDSVDMHQRNFKADNTTDSNTFDRSGKKSFEINDRIVIKPVNDEDNTSVIINFNQGISPFIIILTFVTSISGFMFGYDTGYISTALISIGTDLDHKELTYGNKEFITAATSLGALISSIFAGISADIFGRKPCILLSNLMFLIGAIIQVTAHTFWQMVVGRFIMGFGVGIGSLIAPLYISEIAPKNIRGRLTVINSLWLTGGQLIAYGCGAGLSHVNNGWRILVGLSLIPTVIQFSCFLFLPDTPRFYVMKGQLEKANKVLHKSYVDTPDEVINEKIAELQALNHSIPGKNQFEKVSNAFIQLHTVPSNFRALLIACGLQAIQQFSGWNSLLYFSGTIFETVGFSNSSAVSIIVSGTNFIFTLINFFCIDKVGRRRILLIGLPGMTGSLVVCSIAFHFIGITFNGNDAQVVHTGFSAWGIVIIVFIIVFAAFYAIGIGTVPWQQSELFPQNVRGAGTALATATNWSGNLIISSTFLTMLQNISPPGTFALFASFSAVSTVLTYFCYPELAGLELEEVQAMLTDGFNVKASEQLAKKRRQQNEAENNDINSLKFEPTQEMFEE
ncbi:hypothetical protein Kpol_1053p24 [Vanderwaltozyma polyspora DSM 70294]|uniref:Major facilitator superfamily (MFS) profile domain-containing protein n=1 Tax=Vanderwaltozyma polyspora (strain ATCC 22028 / DSM 70294 / BCRC 21397 / CBS 2163 / NBRC 10782 / NRRL Y-8283 / UCD 57-17) TaxID=436907 RepID=A7TN69_VANPO|nr:uncharacterized protein Kpol_1053p24 [Vanderwaltozyma polyspora DSM 70294]EDO16287.1 hypothetical protein Kpol_1053p24 [Vanderwaltozyma polyspora DSM 70294]